MAMQPKRTVLAVDDDETNLMILTKTGQEAGYAMKSFTCATSAWSFLQANYRAVDIVLLDKMMPGLSGIALLRYIKHDPSLRHKPVIIQTGDVGIGPMREAMESGAYYYLAKPFHAEALTAILNSASAECIRREELLAEMAADQETLARATRQSRFAVKTHAEAKLLAAWLARTAVYPEQAAVGLMELLANAIEHGNLEIGLDRKREWLQRNCWEAELAARMAQTEYRNRAVEVRVENVPPVSRVIIRDEGNGFDWVRYVRQHGLYAGLNEANGRGIGKAIAMLDEVRYIGSGNEAHCAISTVLPQSVRAARAQDGEGDG